MTDLWLVRHGEALSDRVDPRRPLSPSGERAVERTAELLAAEIGAPDLVACSPKLRARQTAQIYARRTGYPEPEIVQTGSLLPDSEPGEFLAFLAGWTGKERILCAGHLSSLAEIASALLSPGTPVAIRFEAGAVCRIRLGPPGPPAGELRMLLNPWRG